VLIEAKKDEAYEKNGRMKLKSNIAATGQFHLTIKGKERDVRILTCMMAAFYSGMTRREGLLNF